MEKIWFIYNLYILKRLFSAEISFREVNFPEDIFSRIQILIFFAFLIISRGFIFAAIKYVLKFNNFKITETGIDEPIQPNYLYLITVIEILLTSEYCQITTLTKILCGLIFTDRRKKQIRRDTFSQIC